MSLNNETVFRGGDIAKLFSEFLPLLAIYNEYSIPSCNFFDSAIMF